MTNIDKEETIKSINEQIDKLNRLKAQIESEIAKEALEKERAIKAEQELYLLPIKEALNTFNKKYGESYVIAKPKYVNTMFGKMSNGLTPID